MYGQSFVLSLKGRAINPRRLGMEGHGYLRECCQDTNSRGEEGL